MNAPKWLFGAGVVLFLSTLPVSTACLFPRGGCYESKWGYRDFAFDRYSASPGFETPAGIALDTSGVDVDPEVIDRLVSEVERCTGRIDRSSFVVKIANDWVLSCDGTQELLPVLTGEDSGCEAKGLVPTTACPCRWRAGIRCPNVIVTTPSMYLFKDALTRFVTGSANPWADSRLVKCVVPTTEPLGSAS